MLPPPHPPTRGRILINSMWLSGAFGVRQRQIPPRDGIEQARVMGIEHAAKATFADEAALGERIAHGGEVRRPLVKSHRATPSPTTTEPLNVGLSMALPPALWALHNLLCEVQDWFTGEERIGGPNLIGIHWPLPPKPLHNSRFINQEKRLGHRGAWFDPRNSPPHKPEWSSHLDSR